MNEIAEEMIHREEGFIPNEDAASETPTPGMEQCPKCNKLFKNAIALRMHDIRKHQNRGWSTTQNFNSATREEKLAKKRAYNRKWRLRRGMAVRPASLKWSPSRRAKFRRTWKQKAETRNQASVKVAAQPKVAANPGVVTFCPRCGCNIKIVAAAIAFGDKQ